MRKLVSFIAAGLLCAAVAVAQPVAAAPADGPVASVAKKKKKKKCKIKNSRGKCVKVPKLPPIIIGGGEGITNGGCVTSCRPDEEDDGTFTKLSASTAKKKKCTAKAKKRGKCGHKGHNGGPGQGAFPVQPVPPSVILNPSGAGPDSDELSAKGKKK